MIAFDTNYLVRHIVQDDEVPCKIVVTTLEAETKEDRSIRILDYVLLETAWVLQVGFAGGLRINYSGKAVPILPII